MTIVNDIITFDTADFNLLSDAAKRSLVIYLEDYASFFSAQLNSQVALAKAHSKTLATSDPIVDSVLLGLATADAPTLALAAPILAQLEAVLNS